ncbi:MAG: hypothetical protein K6G70_10085 [Bacteroidaceae bacterium]|nr:hypothetical protein [Bacteroidaceae bacterium]
MKKILLLFMMCALLPKTAGAQGTPTDDTFTVSDLDYDDEFTWDDETHTGAYYFTVSLSGSGTYSAYNLDLFLPVGIHVIYGVPDGEDDETYFVFMNDGDKMYPKSGGNYTHTISRALHNSYQLRVGCASTQSSNLRKTSGKLFNVYVTIDESAFTSSFSPKPIVKLTGLNLTTSAAEKYVPADFACRPFTTGIPTSRTLPLNVSADNKVGTLILPFDADLPSGLKAYTCNAIDGDLLTLTPAASLAACTPYIVYAESGYSGSISGTVSFSGDNVTDIFANGFLTGVLTGTTVNTGYILQNQGEGPMFYDAEGVTFSLPAGRCYFTPSITPGVKSFAFNFSDPDGIKTIVNYPLSIVNLYDLSGRPVSSPTRGIYIKGTRKVVVK